MDRQQLSKAEHKITLRQRVNEAQALYLSANQQRGLGAGAAYVTTATIQRPGLLQTLNIDVTEDKGDITDVTVSGLSLFCSDSSAAAACFNSKSFGAPKRSIGISIANNQTVVVQGSNVTGGTSSLAVAIYPLKASDVKPPGEQANKFNFIYGLGTVSVPALGAATASLVAIATRPTTLGEVILANHSAGGTAVLSEDVVVEDIIVSGLSMFAGATGAQQISLSTFENSASDIMGLCLNYPIQTNARVEVVLRNYDGANACQVSGGILCEAYNMVGK